ncbi:CBO0543 family protein [Alicyclobacillus sp. SO9]|uniref:CBO0543 family protein n=1 Tax=Alicyclobacillus sp. SO9 TaxID=2665646 RepID=UPI0018E85044|nr:CBO0543 family protein [Alicyclobacillus sp. SO9]QQE80419.1 hypothetical protein GI364_08390 [Alicyclobacillus sp. SO9]
MHSFAILEQARRHLSLTSYDYWLEHSLFSWQWWFLLTLSVVPWVIWWILTDRNRIYEIASYGMLIGCISSLLDLWGTNSLFWAYPHQLLWFLIPALIPVDLSVLPVEHMLIYQYFRTWKSFIVALLVAALIVAFVVEPLFVRFHLYVLYSWKFIYSVPLYMLKAIFARWVIERLKASSR